MSKSKMQNFVIAVVAVVAVVISSQRFSTLANLVSINRNSDDSTKFNIKLSNLSNVNIIGDAKITVDPDFTPTYLGDFEMTVNKPGDGVSYTFDIINEGKIDAKVEKLTLNAPMCTSTGVYSNPKGEEYVCENIIYTLTYTGTNDEVKVGDKIKSGEIVNLTLNVSYNGASWYVPTSPMAISNTNVDISFGE